MSLQVPDSVKLREFSDTDVPVMAKLCNNRNIWDNVRDLLPSPYSEKDAEHFIESCRCENPQFTFAIEYNGEFTGVIGLVSQTDVFRFSAELGYWVGEPFWGRGIATEAVNKIVDYGFSKHGLIRIYSSIFAFNTASKRVMEKAGFQMEGIFQKSVFKNGKFIDEFRYAKINNIKLY